MAVGKGHWEPHHQNSNLKKFLARRRWQRCGQAIRAMKRMSGLMLKRRTRHGSSDSATSTPPLSRNSSRESSRENSPLLPRRIVTQVGQDAPDSDQEEEPTKTGAKVGAKNQQLAASSSGLGRCEVGPLGPRLNLLEARLKEELQITGGSMLYRKQEMEKEKTSSKSSSLKDRT